MHSHFALRQAMYLSGFDEYLKTIKDDKNYLYAGYSAGICVLSPSLRGLELVDEPINPYNEENVIYDGLNIIDFVPVPHYKSDHPESHLMDNVVQFLLEKDIRYQTLKDGDVIIDDTLKSKRSNL